MSTLKTPADGANAERQAILSHIRRVYKRGSIFNTLDNMVVWIKGRSERYQKKPGGLGRASSATQKH